jgi:hypothetical protein
MEHQLSLLTADSFAERAERSCFLILASAADLPVSYEGACVRRCVGVARGRNGNAGEGLLLEPKVFGDHPLGAEACFGRTPASAAVQRFRLVKGCREFADSAA